jgi:threonine dehydratase/serine racemase
MATEPVDMAMIRKAAERIRPYAHRTPVLRCGAVDELAGRELHFKCENFQRIGAFKFRGACNAIMKLPTEVATRGVVTHSSGNHAQAVALAAKIRGIAAHVVMPRNASRIKVQGVRELGARVYECEPNVQSREQTAQKLVADLGAALIPPYNHVDIIAGQGTCAMELLASIPDLDAIVAPVGGGGMISGTCIAAHSANRKIRVIAAEPAGADDAARSLAAGHLVPQTSPDTIADGLRTGLGALTWAIIQSHVDRVVTVSDQQIVEAMRLIWQRMKIIIEPSSATVIAAVLTHEFRAIRSMSKVGLIITGGNVDLDALPWVA